MLNRLAAQRARDQALGMREELEVNRQLWDERVAHHVASSFYDTAGFVAGTNDPLRPFEGDELGPVDGLDLVHLQCHFGLDTLAWARRGARVTGLDFSSEAVAAARRVAAEAELDADFVAADVYDAPTALGGRTFDIVYTGFGALIWLPDLPAWATVVRDLLRPGGCLYLAEFHPITHVFGWQDRTIEQGYFERGPFRWDDEGTYTDTDDGARFEHTASVEWQHTLGDVLSAVLGAGLVVELFHEHDFTLFPRWPDLVREPAGRYVLPSGEPSLPLAYSMRARRP